MVVSGDGEGGKINLWLRVQACNQQFLSLRALLHSIINIENNIVLLLYNVINITTTAIISKYISRKHAVHFKLTQCYLSNLFNTKNFLKRIHNNPLKVIQ